MRVEPIHEAGALKIPAQRLYPLQDPVLAKVVDVIRSSGIPPGGVAEKAGVMVQTVERWLNGQTYYARSTTLAAVLTALGYEMDVRLVMRRGRYH